MICGHWSRINMTQEIQWFFDKCRLCYSDTTDTKRVNMYSKIMYSGYNKVTNINTLANIMKSIIANQPVTLEPMPIGICFDCVNYLLTTKNFIEKCLDTELKLRSDIENYNIKENKITKNCPMLYNWKEKHTIKLLDVTCDSIAMDLKEVDGVGSHDQGNNRTPGMEGYYSLDDDLNVDLSTKLHSVLNQTDHNIKTTVCKRVNKKHSKLIKILNERQTLKSRFHQDKSKSQKFIQKGRDKSEEININESDPYANLTKNIKSINTSDVRSEESDTTFSCNICGAVLGSKGNLIVHQVTHSVERPHACDKCDLKFKLKSHLNGHKRNVHDNEKNHICQECNKGFFSLAQWKIHMYSHNKQYPHACADCGNKFSQKSHLREHMKLHLGIKDVKCPHCQYTTSSRNSLNTHLKGVHNDDKRYMCNECGLRFLYPSSLRKHFTIHSGEKNFRCIDCNKSFRTINACKEHMRIHTKEKPYGCRYCDKLYRTYNGRAVHERIHTGIRPYVCLVCKKSFQTNCNLKTHMKLHIKTAA